MSGSPESAGRRGRKPTRPDPESGPIAALADELWNLKARAGDPSFAEMSGKLGAAASKSSLAAAARGQVLPTWETTWEFVRVLAVDQLGADRGETEREWRERWERARNAGLGITAAADDLTSPPGVDPGARPGGTGHITSGGVVPDPLEGPAAADGAVVGSANSAESEAAQSRRGRPGRAPQRPRNLTRLAGVAALTTAIVGGGGVVAAYILTPSSAGRTGERSESPAPQTESTELHDDSVLEAETIPDGTVVEPGTQFTKVWRLRNTGTVAWRDRYLTRINATRCEAPEMVPIKPTDPGEAVEISVEVRAASNRAKCKIYWKMTDVSRTPLLPGKRPIFLDVQVKKRSAAS